MSNYWVYILLCENDTYYTGYTNDLLARYQSHLDGTGRCKYTRSFKPLALAQCWQVVGDKALAMRVERFLKKLARVDKEKFIAQPKTLKQHFSVKIIAKKNKLSIVPPHAET